MAGFGHAVPSRVVSNGDIATICNTSDEWIFQRTGIRERRVCDPRAGESNLQLCTDALRRALEDANLSASSLDCIICGTITQDMKCPATACMVGARLGSGHAQGWDLAAACCGFVYSINVAHDLIRMGTHKTIGVIGADCISAIADYTNRNVAILFGDGAGAAILQATPDTSKGIIAQVNKADGTGWPDLFVPGWDGQIPATADRSTVVPGCLHMNGKEVFKFAVGTFQELIAETLEKGGVGVADVDMFVCHQSNARIIAAAVEKFGIPQDKVYVNIDRFGNTSGGSVPICLDELVKAGRIKPGMVVMFVAFGAGLTWSSSLWQM
jgi:3-oxoacyl-[acyl-carrier-protein] synthase-3